MSPAIGSFCSFVGALRRPSLLSLCLTLSAGLQAETDDFASLNARIATQQASLVDLEWNLDRSDLRLVEPMAQLARDHMRANQFDAADDVLDRSIQILRFNDGLYTPAQYDLLELSAQNHRNRGDWSRLNEQLDHMGWLYTEQFEGELAEQLDRLKWLGDFHLNGVFEDRPDQQIGHLRQATEINLTALDISRSHGRPLPERHIALLYDLVLKYHMEAQGVRWGGNQSYQLREVVPGSTFIDSRKWALRKRYIGGLRALEEIGELLQTGTPATAEALALVDLYLTDWKVMFNDAADPAADYQRIHGRLAAAGVPDDLLDAYFSRPVVLPERHFHSDVKTAVSARALASDRDAGTDYQLVEPSPRFPGFVRSPQDFNDQRLRSSNHWLTARVTADVVPGARHRRWLNGMLQTIQQGGDWSLPSGLDVADDGVLAELRPRLNQLRFRPMLKDGQPVSTTVSVEYFVPDPDIARYELMRAAPLVTLR